MIKLEGKYNKDCKIFIDKIEETAISTIKEILDDEVSENVPVRIMPDCHAGKDIVIGFTMPLTDRVNPNHIGVDLNCGVLSALFSKEIPLSLEEIDNRIRAVIPMGFSRCSEKFDFGFQSQGIKEVCNKIGLDYDDVCRQAGSLGGGNHFIEIGEDAGKQVLFIHSGSRNFGKQVCDYHATKAKANGSKYLFGTDMDEYLQDMRIAQGFATTNRDIIFHRIIEALSMQDCVTAVIDTPHNYIGDDNIIRKGAVSANYGEALAIPMNMRDGVLLCTGLGNKDWNSSAPHGAGRIYSRAKAKKELSFKQFQEEMEGIYSTSVTEANLDESPMAYKSIQTILDTIGDTVTINSIVKPILNIKA